MKILHVVHQFLPHHHHGAEISTYELAAMQQSLGHESVVVAGEHGHQQDELYLERDRYRELTVHRIYFNPRTPNGWLAHNGFDHLWRRLLEYERPDIVHIQQTLNLSLSLIDVTHEMNIPMVFTVRDFAMLCARINLVRGDHSLCRETDLEADCVQCLHHDRGLERGELLPALVDLARENVTSPRSWELLLGAARAKLLSRGVAAPVRLETIADMRRRNDAVIARLRKVAAITAISEDTATRFKKLARGRVSVRTLQQVPDTRRCVWKQRPLREGPLRIGYIGKMAWIKGVHVLLSAFRRLPTGKAELHLFGGPTRTDVKQLAFWRQLREQGNLPAVTFHSVPFDPSRISEVMEQFDVLVIPSLWFEAYGRVVGEALASGIPVVCSDEGGPATIIEDGVNGLSFKLGDAKALAATLRRFIDEPTLLETLSRNARPPKTPETYAAEVLALYDEVLSVAQ